MALAINLDPVRSEWDGGSGGIGDPSRWQGWLNEHMEHFDAHSADLRAKLQESFDNLIRDPSNPAYLASYQSSLQEYNLHRMTQSNSSKNLADMQKQNARNLG